MSLPAVYQGSRYLPSVEVRTRKDGVKETTQGFGVEATINNQPGQLSTIIPKGAPLPAHNTKRYHPMVNYQDTIKVNCYKGEHSKADRNHSLGEFIISGLLPRTTDQAQGVDLTFTINRDGVVLVDAVEVENPNNHLKVKLEYKKPDGLVTGVAKGVAKEISKFFLPSGRKKRT